MPGLCRDFEPETRLRSPGVSTGLPHESEDADLTPVGDDAAIASIFEDYPLKAAMTSWHNKMPAPLLLEWATGVSSFIETASPEIGFATAFAGCDITVKVVRLLQEHINEVLGTHVELSHVWACEKNPQKQQFLKDQFSPRLLFNDFAEVSSDSAYDVVSGSKQIVPYAEILFAGFPCTSKSPMNRQRGQNSHCVQDCTASTGIGFQLILAHLTACSPQIVVLENVPTLAANGEDTYIMEQLAQCGYWCRAWCNNVLNVLCKDVLHRGTACW